MIKSARSGLKPRSKKAHKGDFGRIFILAGSRGYTGAAYLASMGALRSGAGLITLGVPDKVYTILARRHAEVMVRPFASTRSGSFALSAKKEINRFMASQDVLAIGPGLSQNPSTQSLVRSLVCRSKMPVVLDADGLNAFKGNAKLLKTAKSTLVLTPHPGEFKRLFGGKLGTDQKSRVRRAKQAAKDFGVILVLKGHQTVIADPLGRASINRSGNPGMASGGTGDVLTGMIAALLGQKLLPSDAARIAVFFHGMAGDLAARKMGETSLTAGDILEFIPAAFKKVLGK